VHVDPRMAATINASYSQQSGTCRPRPRSLGRHHYRVGRVGPYNVTWALGTRIIDRHRWRCHGLLLQLNAHLDVECGR
jgi:hypothetical protein